MGWGLAFTPDLANRASGTPLSKSVRTELYAVGTVFLLLVLLNYIVFKP
jgi:hypothetical protein